MGWPWTQFRSSSERRRGDAAIPTDGLAQVRPAPCPQLWLQAPSARINQMPVAPSCRPAKRSLIRSVRRCLSATRLSNSFVRTSTTTLSSPTSRSRLRRNRISRSPAPGGPIHGSSGQRRLQRRSPATARRGAARAAHRSCRRGSHLRGARRESRTAPRGDHLPCNRRWRPPWRAYAPRVYGAGRRSVPTRGPVGTKSHSRPWARLCRRVPPACCRGPDYRRRRCTRISLPAGSTVQSSLSSW